MSSIQVIAGSMLGSSEYVAEAAADVLETAGHDVQLHLKPVFDELPVEGQIWLICTSTSGTGELPDNIKTFAENVDDTNKDLSTLKFAIIGLGDSSYVDSYCHGALIMETLLLSKNSQQIVDKFLIDARETDSEAEDKAEDWVQENIGKF
ncbi:MAG: FMN-binding protein MioC [Gammaproteobacteria bacterium]|jgi:MioC protein|nr:MAG: FMN-binding protein MioC [Gammaproteobacteria bacterium]PHR83572.1 MAG: FMN-binding protein MioC [Colwellia sp.]